MSDVDTAGYSKWELPRVSNSDISLHGTTAEKLELIQKQAYEEGYNEGFALGQNKAYAEKREELTKNNTSLRSIIELLTEPLKDIDDEIVKQLAELSMLVAKQVVRRELHSEQGEIVGIVREAMTALPASTRKIILNIHPDDAGLIRNAFSLGQDVDSEEQRWKIVEDPMITRGGCKIASQNSRIDATVEARLSRVIITLLGGERESDD
jgi:flagellar assembly protein FliH